MSKKSKALKTVSRSATRQAATVKADAAHITESDLYMYGAGSTTVASLYGTGSREARSRQVIYAKWSAMGADPLVGAGLGLLVTAALGGHETSGDLVFIETTPAAQKDKRLSTIAEEIGADLGPMFNAIAAQKAFEGAVFGDSYARVYCDDNGVTDLYVDEMIYPPLVQPFERGSRTIGYAIYTGERNFERLDTSQMARLKMPRTQWIPQYGVIEKSLKLHIREDDADALPIMPSMAGGSLLYNAEAAYDNLTASLLGLVGQRWMDSIDEQMIAVNLDSMTLEQQKRFLAAIKDMLVASKSRAEDAVRNGRPVLERIRHVMPVSGDKQLTTIGPANGGQPGRSGSISIDDVIFHARILTGSFGVDLSMLGFADQLAGGLGEGGIFRASASVAERSRIIRRALAEFFDQIIDIHTMRRYGVVFPRTQRPWTVNFFGSISALEAERQRTRADAMNGGMILVQAVQMLKEAGATKEIMGAFLTKQMLMDEEEAKLLATIVDQKTEEPGGDGGGPGGFGA